MKEKNMDIILINFEAQDNKEILQTLGKELFDKGYVNEEYVDAVLLRESSFPTGLNISGDIKVAIPHADSCHVKEAQIAFASLKNPVKFNNIEDPENQIDVNLVFMLAIKNPEKQVETLQKLMAIFEKKDVLEQLTKCESPNEAKTILKKELN